MSANLHPHAQEALNGTLRSTDPFATPDLSTLRAAKPATATLIGPGRPVHRSWNSSVLVDEKLLNIRWYQPSSAPSDLLILFVHGGGWVSGTLDDYDALCRSLAVCSDGTVVSLEYSLAPEARFPIAVEQVCHALLRAIEWAHEQGVKTDRLAVVGDSAGANLIGGALHTLAQDNALLPSKAVFVYPATDTSLDHDSWRKIGDSYNLNRTKMLWFWDQYLGIGWREYPALALSAQVSPLFSPCLAQFPQSLVITATHDPLKDEGSAFFDRLSAAGVAAEHIEVPGQIHGFLRFDHAMRDPQWGADAIMKRIGDFLNA